MPFRIIKISLLKYKCIVYFRHFIQIGRSYLELKFHLNYIKITELKYLNTPIIQGIGFLINAAVLFYLLIIVLIGIMNFSTEVYCLFFQYYIVVNINQFKKIFFKVRYFISTDQAYLPTRTE